MSMGRPTLKENLSAVLVLLVIFGGIAAGVWWLKSSGGLMSTPKHVCPYCGQEIKVDLKKGEEKKP